LNRFGDSDQFDISSYNVETVSGTIPFWTMVVVTKTSTFDSFHCIFVIISDPEQAQAMIQAQVLTMISTFSLFFRVGRIIRNQQISQMGVTEPQFHRGNYR
jgi:hypothetical protein